MQFNRFILEALLASVIVLLSMRGSAGQLNEDELPRDCEANMENIKKCISAAVDASKATGCNWYLLIDPLDTCIRDAVIGCNYDEQEVWYQYIDDFNKTMTSDDCYPPCTGQEARGQLMFQCFNDANFEQLISDLSSSTDVQSSNPSCGKLSTMSTCLLEATNGCPALTDITHDRIYNVPNSAEVFSKCGVSPFLTATTNAPVALLDTNSMQPYPYTVTKSPDSLNGGEQLLVILGSIVIAATIIVIIIVIVLTIRRRRAEHRRSLLRDWRPNGQKVYMDDEPQFTTAQRGDLYRPVAISHNSGFLNEGVRVQ